MHYHYFTLEQRHALERTIRQRMTEPGMETVLEKLRTPVISFSCGRSWAKAAHDKESRSAAKGRNGVGAGMPIV